MYKLDVKFIGWELELFKGGGFSKSNSFVQKFRDYNDSTKNLYLIFDVI